MNLFGPRYKLVFDGKNYAIKRRDGKYFSFCFERFWWSKDSEYFSHCWIADKDRAETWLKRFNS